jgi:hypothetical protein
MKPKTRSDLFRWAYFALLWLVGATAIVVLSEFAVGPALQWLLYDMPYQFPTWERVSRMALFIIFMGFFAGTITWFYEKKTSNR